MSCTNGKTLPAAPTLLLRSVEAGPDRLGSWMTAVNTSVERIPLRQLYKGQQWQSALGLERAAVSLGYDVKLWVASAGLGLVPVDHLAPAYGATFGSGPDSVGDTIMVRRGWWTGLAVSAGASVLGQVRAECDQLMVVSSPTYLNVLAPDLRTVADEALAVVSSAQVDGLDVVLSSGLRSALGGSALSQNARAAGQFLRLCRGTSVGASAAGRAWAGWREDRVAATRRPGRRLQDSDVRRFVLRELTASPGSRTVLLQRLRASGWACEQSRFAKQYALAVEGAQ